MTTADELKVMGSLCEAYRGYAALPKQHPEEMGEFHSAFHRLQDILAIRVARRADPENWPCKDSHGHTVPIDDETKPVVVPDVITKPRHCLVCREEIPGKRDRLYTLLPDGRQLVLVPHLVKADGEPEPEIADVCLNCIRDVAKNFKWTRAKA
jgi:hypothetical protein